MSFEENLLQDQPAAKIILLGVFHLQDSGLDRCAPQHCFDVFSEHRQCEIKDVVRLLTKYGATKVAVELMQERQPQVDRDFQAYLRGDFMLSADEICQIGFRVSKRLGHERVYCVNAWDRYYSPPVDFETYLQEHGFQEANDLMAPHTPEKYARDHGQEHLLSQWRPYFKKQFEQQDTQINLQTLRETLLSLNEEENVLKSHGSYLVDWFKVGTGHDYPGVDWITAWYNRNLRIFANLQRITKSRDERILLIIGAGHLPILRHCVLASPEYDLVEVCEFLGTRDRVDCD